LKRIYDCYPSLKDIISGRVLSKYHISLEDVPSWEDGPACHAYVAPLSRDFIRYGVGTVHSSESLQPEQRTKEFMETARDEVKSSESDALESPPYEDSEDYEESSISELVRVNIYCERLFNH
jgi:hypothetical protein